MNYKKATLTALLLLGFWVPGAMAQKAVLCTGKDATGSGGSVSYSIGQTVYTTELASGFSVTAGVQQPFEISTVTGIKEASGISLECIVFPNPTADLLHLKIESNRPVGLTYQLLDTFGKSTSIQPVHSSNTDIHMSAYPSGVYFLRVSSGQKDLKTFKIIKN